MPNIIITEWMTWLTDLMLFVQCFYSARILSNLSRDGISAWAMVFYLAAIAAFLGAVQHGLHANFDASFNTQLGIGVIITLSTASLCLGWIFSQSFLSTGLIQRAFRIFLVFKLAFFVAQAIKEPRFILAVIDYGSTLLLLLAANAISWRDRPGARHFVAAILIALGGAVIQALKIAPHPFFNHNDLFHVIQMFSFYYFLQGARQEYFPLTRNLQFQ